MTNGAGGSRVGSLPTAPILAALFVGTLVMGCAEVLVMGMLDLIAADLDAPVSAVGGLVSANALGIAFGGPLLTLLTSRLDRRPVLLCALAVFCALNLLPALGAGLPVFVAARVIIGAVEGLFIAAAITTATSIVAPDRVGRAMAVVISGFAVSGAVGMPLGRLLGDVAGWRGSFLAVVVAGAVVLAVCALVVPRVPTDGRMGMLGQLRSALAPRVLAVLAIGVLLFAGVAAALTYLVPFLDRLAGVSGPWVSVCLLGYGVAAAVGSFAGGRFADAGAARALVLGAVGVSASLLAMFLWGTNLAVAALGVLGLGLFSAGITSPWQHRVEHLAGPGAVLAASLPASAGNLGDAVGAFGGGLALDAADVSAAVLTGALLAALAVAAAVTSISLRPASSDAGPRLQRADPHPPSPTRGTTP